jgi:hypothetical protein
MHGVVVVDDHARKFTQRFGGIGMNGLPNDHPLLGALVGKFVGLNVLHAAHKLTKFKIGVGLPGPQILTVRLWASISCRISACLAVMSTRAILASARSRSAVAGTWGVCRRALATSS